MSVEVTEHTRRRGEGHCRVCGRPILPTEQYRQLIAINEDWTDKSFARWTAHTGCVLRDEGWELTAHRVRRELAEAAAAARQVAHFNRAAPVGTPVRVWPGVREGEGEPTRVRAPGAFISSSGHPMVAVDRPGGNIALTHVEVSP